MIEREVPGPVPRIRVAAILRKENTILLVQHQKDGRTYWLLPGGGVDSGESLAEALQREVKEETGFDIAVGDIALVNDTLPPDKHRHIVNICFYAEILGGNLSKGDEPRLKDVKFVPVSDLLDLDLIPDLREPLAALLTANQPSGPSYLGNLWRELS